MDDFFHLSELALRQSEDIESLDGFLNLIIEYANELNSSELQSLVQETTIVNALSEANRDLLLDEIGWIWTSEDHAEESSFFSAVLDILNAQLAPS